MQGAEVVQWSTQQRRGHPKVQASKQASKDGLGESEWCGVVLVAKWVGQGCFIGQGWRGMPWFGMCKARASTWVSLGVEGN